MAKFNSKITSKILSKLTQNQVIFNLNRCLHIRLIMYNTSAGNYCESVIPDPIPNSEVKPFSADGTLS